MRTLLERFAREERGATMVEYGLMVTLIAVVCIITVGVLGGEVRDMFDSIEPEVAAAQNANPPAD